MNTNVDLFHDSTNNSNGILTSESNEIGSLKIIMPDKLNQLAARSSYICHIDDFVKGNKDYYGFDIQSDREMEYDYELIINKIKHVNNNTGKYEHISILGSGNIDGYIKIGKTNNIDKRENTIRTGNIDFKIIAFVGRDIENELHSKFEIKRMEREWFHLSDNDIDNIINEYGFIRVRNSVKDKKI